MRFFIELIYNGKNFHGWQIQKKVKTVEGTIEYCLSKLLKKPINIIGAGRTDAGVHAKQMFAHFDYENQIHSDFLYKLNIFLPNSIRVNNIFQVKNYVHARFDAISRTYKYFFTYKKNPFYHDVCLHYFYSLDHKKMNKASKILMDYKDFSFFCKKNSSNKNNICHIYQSYWSFKKNIFYFTIEANRFLRSMVRFIIGSLLDVGRKKIDIDEFIKIMQFKKINYDYSKSIVPPYGLFLTKILYPEDIFYEEKIEE
ncbi:tRNA pseudouridine(38-40) synthase TruA [Blattabacterium cuenoti]|uniref:tRNA pseudouridine(38-40) synthase TruA n=1 Tax=Blattabacterium cuenoti TaxID=1653831 RepID=UPI00163D315B|nr:tRNA pseudouridine(38-40) synthase TruA [Blattabacterium cuenoti]